MKPLCSIFMPAFNAGSTISQVFNRIPKETWAQIHAVFIINDGSSDNTIEVVNQLKNTYEKIQLYNFEKNQGYGGAVNKGIELCLESDCTYICCLHADGQYPSEKISEFLTFMEKNNTDILQGSRHKAGTALEGGMPLYKYIAGKVLVFFENLVFDLNMTDYHSGFMFYRKMTIRNLPINKLSCSFDIDLEIIALAKTRNLKISELAIPTRYADEESYLNPITYGLRVLRILYRYIVGYYKRLNN